MKKRVLMCTEASFLPTGYGVYSKELLSRLSQYEELEVAELACYTNVENPKFKEIPWKAYANKPLDGSPEMLDYLSNTSNEYGEFTFNTVCMHFMPDFVIDIRDPWVFEFQVRSPFRKFFKHVIMPTVDAMPQNPEWINMFADADGVFTYSEFGRDVITSQSSNINFLGVASPSASDDFHSILNKDMNRASLNLPPDIYILGTVMRNQRRKLYPDLFETFSRLIKETGREDVYLYCHTNFPDVGWDIPELLMNFDLSNKVLFTYKCKQCSHVSASLFKDSVSQCEKCGNFSNNIAGISNSLNDKELNKVYNCFNVYVQYANSEGFGMPQLEAAKAGNLVVSVDYSAMSSIISNICAYPIRVMHFSKECETGCYRAVPDNEDLFNTLRDIIGKSQGELYSIGAEMKIAADKAYNWDKTADTWAKFFIETPTVDNRLTWYSNINILEPSEIRLDFVEPVDRANYLIEHVLRRPEMLGSELWRRLLRDLTYGNRLGVAGDEFYFNEHHIKDTLRTIPFSYQDAYNEMVKLRNYYNTWEKNRAEHLKGLGML
jgi:hypothetical protein